MATHNTPLPETNNSSLLIIGYLVNFERILTLQTRHRYESPTQAQQAAIEAALTEDLADQFASLKKLFITNSACEKCGKSPLVVGSVHEHFTNPKTQEIWDKLVDIVDELKKVPLDLKQIHLDYVKKLFEELELAYRKDNVAAAGLC